MLRLSGVWRGGMLLTRRCVRALGRPCLTTPSLYYCSGILHLTQRSCSSSGSSNTRLATPSSSAADPVASHDTHRHNAQITQDVQAELQSVQDDFTCLLEDRRTNYRADVIAARLPAARVRIAHKLLQRLPSHCASEDFVLTRDTLRQLRTAWLPLLSQHGSDCDSRAHEASVAFYTLVLSSTLIRSDAEVRMVWQEMTEHDALSPCAAIYRAVLLALPSLYLTVTGTNTNGLDRQEWQLHRRELGEAASYYLGHALALDKQHRVNGQHVTHAVWDAFFVDATLAQMAPKLIDLWWDSLLQSCDASGESALPYVAVHALLTSAAAQRDVERAMRFFQAANQRGVCLPGQPATTTTVPGALTTRHDINNVDSSARHVALQQCQVRLLAKLLSTAKSLKADGGLRAMVVRDIQRLIDPSIVQALPWGVVNDILSGLSMPSAMQLLKFCAASREGGEASVPFMLWAALLRRCAKDHLLDEAESLFRFILARYACEQREKAELVEIMLRMYATLPTPDYASAMSLFLEHGQSAGPQAQATFYQLLVRAADSRNTAMMTFLEGCAAGVQLSEESFEALLGANPLATIAALSRKLPHDYSPSKLDAQLRIPANVDAHLRREEALKARGKPLYDSTGDAIG